jgi:molybdate/tungstate transport system substrate-binding protein
MNVRQSALALVAPLIACGTTGGGRDMVATRDTAVIYVAASLTNALKPRLDAFSALRGAVVVTESGGSMEHVRKITELGRIPDLIVLADEEVFPRELAPRYVTWWATFARNRMVVAYTDKSAGHDSITPENWYRVLSRRGVEVGRSDPKLAPVGYRALTIFSLAEKTYHQPGLASKLLDNAPPRNVRANAADLAALLAAGELDYIYDYESVARAHGFHFIVLPDAVTGRPVRYALSIPVRAPHSQAGARLLQFLLSDSSRMNLRAAHVDMLDDPIVSGAGAPAFLTRAQR